ncbi:MAG: type IV secretory system conjugative DNA transfer family protein [Alphaproteobacteria bacterium]|nr:type IV secretory system conjugative DNA transfer family protein [Alphaproteobacteria bacterium]
MVYCSLAGQGYVFASSFLLVLFSKLVRSKTVFGSHGSRTLHGSARFATMKDIKRSGLLSKTGVVVGAFNGRCLRHNGPEHVLVFAPTCSGKGGVSVVIPTLLEWRYSAVALDIKGKLYHHTFGYRASIGQRILVFDSTCEHRACALTLWLRCNWAPPMPLATCSVWLISWSIPKARKAINTSRLKAMTGSQP